MTVAAPVDFTVDALRFEPKFQRICRRPYTRHVDDHVLKTEDDMVLTIFKLDGYCFETADISEINNRLMGRNDIIRTLANVAFAAVAHVIRREVEPKIASTFDNDFCRELDERYDASLARKRMFVNDVYLTIVRRTLQGHAGTFESLMARAMGRKTAAGDDHDLHVALAELRDAATAVRENLSAYGARQLGVVNRDGVFYSEPLEFLAQILNGAIPRPMHLPRMPLDEALALKRLFFGKNAIEIRGAGPSDTRYRRDDLGAGISALQRPGSLDNLLRVPYEFVATQSFAIIDRPEAAKQIDRVSRQVDMSDEAGSVISEHLEVARNELVSSEAIYGEHHMTVMCLGRSVDEVTGGRHRDRRGADRPSIIWAREDLNCEPAFWAQLPGNFPYIARKSIISSKNFAGFVSLHNYPSGSPNRNHWGPAISVFETSSQTAYYL